MGLSSLRIAHLRCIGAASLELDARRNFVFGPNGAGKTSLLEAAYVLGRGRSFRIRHNAGLVQRGASHFEVAGIATEPGRPDRRIGVRFGAGQLDVRVDGAHGQRTSALAAILPVHVLEPGMHSLIGEGPSQRRRFLDWGLFHVEPGYLATWREYRRALGQRNAALKEGLRGAAFEVWNEQLATAAARVDGARSAYVDRWLPRVLGIARRLVGLELSIEFDAGGYRPGALLATLELAAERDRRARLTQTGPHRADLRLRVDGAPARDAASRGQQKLVAAALILGQVALHVEARPGGGILLVDDPAAELDPAALVRLVAELERLPTQMLVTGLGRAALEPLGEGRVFHVEQGVVQAQSV